MLEEHRFSEARHHLPYILRVALCDSDEEVRALVEVCLTAYLYSTIMAAGGLLAL